MEKNDEQVKDAEIIEENSNNIQPIIYHNENINNKEQKRSNDTVHIILSILITFACCLILSLLVFNYYIKQKTGEVTKVVKDVTVTDTGIADSVEKIYDAVVVIEVYNQNQLYSTGTGFVFKTDENYGYILTNDHVIESGSEIRVIFSDDKEVTAEVVGSDSYSDVAVLAVEKDKTISVAQIGSSEDLRVGDTTFAVGAPLSSETYSWTVTRGILSGKNRTVEVSTNGFNSTVIEVLQTDAAINSGNSGGPLCNSNGEVIGITNMKIASSEVEGMGFAIPVETAIEYANKFINNESISRPYLGISLYDLSSSMFSDTTGIYIEQVEKDSPADKGGLQRGDIITKIGKIEVENSSYFLYELYKYQVGDKVKITVKRNNEQKELEVTLGSQNKTT